MGLAMNKHLLQSARICAVTATSLILGTTFPNSSWTQAKQSPNIVFILMDNLGYGELGVYGGGITRGAAVLTNWRPKERALQTSMLRHNAPLADQRS